MASCEPSQRQAPRLDDEPRAYEAVDGVDHHERIAGGGGVYGGRDLGQEPGPKRASR